MTNLELDFEITLSIEEFKAFEKLSEREGKPIPNLMRELMNTKCEEVLNEPRLGVIHPRPEEGDVANSSS